MMRLTAFLACATAVVTDQHEKPQPKLEPIHLPSSKHHGHVSIPSSTGPARTIKLMICNAFPGIQSARVTKRASKDFKPTILANALAFKGCIQNQDMSVEVGDRIGFAFGAAADFEFEYKVKQLPAHDGSTFLLVAEKRMQKDKDKIEFQTFEFEHEKKAGQQVVAVIDAYRGEQPGDMSLVIQDKQQVDAKGKAIAGQRIRAESLALNRVYTMDSGDYMMFAAPIGAVEPEKGHERKPLKIKPDTNYVMIRTGEMPAEEDIVVFPDSESSAFSNTVLASLVSAMLLL